MQHSPILLLQNFFWRLILLLSLVLVLIILLESYSSHLHFLFNRKGNGNSDKSSVGLYYNHVDDKLQENVEAE